MLLAASCLYAYKESRLKGAERVQNMHWAPQNPLGCRITSNVNGLYIKFSILHSDEVEGALSWVNSLLALFGVTLA